MKATVRFLSSGKSFNPREIEKWGHGFLIASHVRHKLDYVLYASHRHPGHDALSRYFQMHYDEYEILGGGGIVIHRSEMKMYPLSSIGYIPMSVAHAILPVLAEKLKAVGVSEKLGIKSHEDEIKETIKKLGSDWSSHEPNF